MPYFGSFGPDFKNLYPYLKSAPSNLSNGKISRKKSLNLGLKMRYLGIFGI